MTPAAANHAARAQRFRDLWRAWLQQNPTAVFTTRTRLANLWGVSTTLVADWARMPGWPRPMNYKKKTQVNWLVAAYRYDVRDVDAFVATFEFPASTQSHRRKQP
jgi:hypothetical protein